MIKMPIPAQGPITLYAPKPVSVRMFPPALGDRPNFRSRLKSILSVLIVSGALIGLYPFADEVLGVITQGGSAITLDKVLDESFNLSLEGYLEGSQLRSTATSGAPLVIASTDLVANLNADLLDGQHGNYYLDWGNFSSKPTILSSLDGVSNDGGNIDLIAGAHVTITPSDLNNSVTISANEGAGGWVDDGTTVRLDTVTDKVGIGTTAPDGTLHVNTGTAGSVTAHSFYNDLVVENSGDAGISILTTNSSYGGLIFGSPSSNIRGWIKYYGSSNILQFGQNGSDHLWLKDSEAEFQQATGVTTTSGDLTLDPADEVIVPSDTWLVFGSSADGMRMRHQNGFINSMEFVSESTTKIEKTNNGGAFVIAANDATIGEYEGLRMGGAGAQAITSVNWLNKDADFSVEGLTDANLIYANAGADTVGIGTNAPDGKLHIFSATAGTVTPFSYADDLVIENNNDGGISILMEDDEYGYVVFGSPSSPGYTQIASRYNVGLYLATDSIIRLFFDDANTQAVFNSNTEDYDFRIEGLADTDLFFADASADSIGIGTDTPGQKLEVNGGIRLNTVTAQPTCDSTVRGTLWFTQGGVGVADQLEVCAKDAANAYAWRTIY